MQTKHTPAEFLSQQAMLFSMGAFELASQSLQTPTIIRIGDRSMAIGSPEETENILRHYHNNLRVEGYVRTDVEFLHHQFGADGRCQTFLKWININARDAVINELEASYICRLTDTADWIVDLVEFLAPPNPNRAAGLPIY